MSYNKINNKWEDILKIIQENLTPQLFNTWFSGVKYIDFKDNELKLAVPNLFCKNWLEKNYYQFLKDILVDQLGIDENVLIKFQVDSLKTPGQSRERKKNTNQDDLQKKYDKTGLNPNYAFESFIIGDSNRFAHAACMAVAQSPAKSYNPLFVYGGVGLGKTHLMHAIGNFIINKNSIHSTNISYISSEKFTNELINAIRDDSTESFRDKYRNFDILLIDDIQFLAGKEKTQEEFFHTFNALYNAGKQIVITSDRPPKDITSLESRLVSRFEWGLITDISQPDLETRIAILQKKAQSCQTEISEEIIQYIASKILTNIRQLEGALNKLDAYATLTQTKIDFPLAKQILKDFITIEEKEISIQMIQKHTAEYFNLKPSILLSKKRSKNIVTARHIAMYLTKELTDYSLTVIGDSFGGKDHTTVIHSCNKIKEQIKTDKKLKYSIDKIINQIQNGPNNI
ncbi:MAG: chromosomal replication initiator protein DnaA [Atribacterota bacterium]|jgi:chromosomal replication initiator protein|nr:chromosomal replication initiator protein DnaA [Atribacterota bacterium]MDD4288126.1 chromosomal replication initiator protein DnaA [Atribacterota bacterium]